MASSAWLYDYDQEFNVRIICSRFFRIILDLMNEFLLEEGEKGSAKLDIRKLLVFSPVGGMVMRTNAVLGRQGGGGL